MTIDADIKGPGVPLVRVHVDGGGTTQEAAGHDREDADGEGAGFPHQRALVSGMRQESLQCRCGCMVRTLRAEDQVGGMSGMKVYVVVPYKGRDRQAARMQYFRAKAALEERGYQVAAGLDKPGPSRLTMPYSGEVKDRELYEMGKHLMHMSCCDAVYPVDGWDSAPECVAEVYAAEAYGLERLEAM